MFSGILEKMQTVSQEIPQITHSNPEKNTIWIIALLTVVILGGIIGYSIAFNVKRSAKNQITTTPANQDYYASCKSNDYNTYSCDTNYKYANPHSPRCSAKAFTYQQYFR